MNCSHIVFDADRTLFDFDRSEQEAFLETALRYNIPAAEQVYADYQAINDRLWKLHEEGKIAKDALRLQRYQELFACWQLEINPENFNADYTEALSTKSNLFEDALPVCSALSKTYPMILATNGTACVQKRRFAGSPICSYFQQIYISEEVGFPKPDPRFFQKILSDFQIESPCKVLMIGDSLRADIAGARAVGFKTCWLNPDQAANQSGIEPDVTISSLTELLEKL